MAVIFPSPVCISGIIKSMESSDERIQGLSEISSLSEKQVKYLVIRNEHYFRKIFQGKIFNQRHEDYKKGGLIRVNLTYKVHLTLFTTDQHIWVMDSLMYIFCKKHQEYVDYLLKVLFPEALIKIYMERFKSSHEETELIMIRHVEIPHR